MRRPRRRADHVTGRLVARRIPDFHAEAHRAAGQDTLFDLYRFHAFFTTADPHLLDTVAADKTHRQHAVIEQVHADLKNSALAHLPSVIFSPGGGRVADLRVCVVDSVVDAAARGRWSARADEFGGLSPGRVAG
jgi:hypothetical protein